MDEILCHVRTVLADPGKRNGFLLITDFIDILNKKAEEINKLAGNSGGSVLGAKIYAGAL